MTSKPFDPDDEEALARAFGWDGKGRRSKRGRKRIAAPRRTRAWCVPSARTVGAADVEGAAAKQATRLPERTPEGGGGEQPLTLSEFLEGLPAQHRVAHVEPEDFPDY